MKCILIIFLMSMCILCTYTQEDLDVIIDQLNELKEKELQENLQILRASKHDAVKKLGELGSAASSAVPHIIKAYKREEVTLQTTYDALSNIASPEAIVFFLEEIESKESYISESALNYLVYMDDEKLNKICREMFLLSDDMKISALKAMKYSKKISEVDTLALRELLKSKNDEVCSGAIRSLRKDGVLVELVLPYLKAFLHEDVDRFFVTKEAIITLGTYRSASKSAIGALFKIYEKNGSHLYESIEALGLIDFKNERIKKIIMQSLVSQEHRERSAAINVLYLQKNVLMEALDGVIDYLKGYEQNKSLMQSYYHALWILHEYDQKAEKALPVLSPFLQSDNEDILRIVMYILQNYGEKSSIVAEDIVTAYIQKKYKSFEVYQLFKVITIDHAKLIEVYLHFLKEMEKKMDRENTERYEFVSKHLLSLPGGVLSKHLPTIASLLVHDNWSVRTDIANILLKKCRGHSVEYILPFLKNKKEGVIENICQLLKDEAFSFERQDIVNAYVEIFQEVTDFQMSIMCEGLSSFAIYNETLVKHLKAKILARKYILASDLFVALVKICPTQETVDFLKSLIGNSGQNYGIYKALGQMGDSGAIVLSETLQLYDAYQKKYFPNEVSTDFIEYESSDRGARDDVLLTWNGSQDFSKYSSLNSKEIQIHEKIKIRVPEPPLVNKYRSRYEIIYALSETGSLKAIPALMRDLEVKDPNHRRCAIKSIASLVKKRQYIQEKQKGVFFSVDFSEVQQYLTRIQEVLEEKQYKLFMDVYKELQKKDQK